MDLEMRLQDGAGPIRLGMTREEVRAALGVPFETFRRSADSTESDLFAGLYVVVGYDLEGRCDTIEIEAHAHPRPRLDGRELLGVPYREVREWVLTLGAPIEEDGAGLVVDSLGLGIYAPFARKAPEEPVEAVLVARRGYWSAAAP